MRNALGAVTLERKLSLLAVKNGCIILKDADIAVAFQVELPEPFTVTSAEYEATYSAWYKAIKVLPDYSIVHKQGFFIKKNYQPDIEKDELSFLSRSFEWHFNECPFLNHYCYLLLTKTTRERSRRQGDLSAPCRGRIVSQKIADKKAAAKFIEAVGQFERVMNGSGFATLTRLVASEIIGRDGKAGIIKKYFSLSRTDTTCLRDIGLYPEKMRVGDDILCLRTLSDVEDLPSKVGTDTRFEKLSIDRSDCRLSFTVPMGALLLCNHVYNQYIFIDDHAESLRNFEQTAWSIQSLSRYSHTNQANKEWIDEYLNEVHSKGLASVRYHCNVMVWSNDRDELKRIRNNVGSQLALTKCKPRHNMADTPMLFRVGIFGNEADFPVEKSSYTSLGQALCLFVEEANYKSSLSLFGIKMVDRASGRPLYIDISDLPMKKGITTNRNKFIPGSSGPGKSFFANHMVRQYYEQGAYVLLVDIGNSYWGLSQLTHNRTHGEDGIYFIYTNGNPIALNPPHVEDRVFDIEKKESTKTLILILWKRDDEVSRQLEEVTLSNAVSVYIEWIGNDRSVMLCFNTFYEFVRNDYRQWLAEKNAREKDFDIDNFLNVFELHYRGGEYNYLLNSDKELDLLHKRFIVFELDNIKDHKILFPMTTIIIMEVFINKMRKLKEIRKLILIEKAWKAIASANMTDYIRYLYKTIREYFGEAIVVIQEAEDIISPSIVKESIISNSDCKILLDQRKYLNKFDSIQNLLGLTDKERSQILSTNMANHPGREYKEAFTSLGGMQSAVYVTEVSLDEYYTCTTGESEKMELFAFANKLGGNFELAIKRLAESRRNPQSSTT